MIARVLFFYLISVSAFAGDQKTMQEKAEQWFLKFQQASPEKQAKMLMRRNFCLTLPQEERKKTCGKSHQKQSPISSQQSK